MREGKARERLEGLQPHPDDVQMVVQKEETTW